MQEALVQAIVAIAVVFAGLTLTIVGNKLYRDLRDRRRRKRRASLEPIIDRYAHGLDREIITALGSVPRGGDRVVVEAILIDRVQTLSGVRLVRLNRAFEELRYVDEYIEKLEDRNWWRRAEAAEKLGRTSAERALPNLTRAMEDDESSEVRFRAATALGRLGGVSAIRPLVKALSEPNRWSTIRIGDILLTMGPEVIRELTLAFPKMNLHGQCSALDLIAAKGHADVGPWLRQRLADEETDVRSRAASALGAVGDLDAGTALVHALEDTQWPVRAMAAKSLGAILHTGAIEELSASLRDREWWVRANAAEALKTMGPVGLEALEKMLDDFDPYARHQAVLMLEEAGVLDEEIGFLVDGAPEKRAAALSLINRMIHAGLHGRLHEIAETHANAQVRELLISLLPEQALPQEIAP